MMKANKIIKHNEGKKIIKVKKTEKENLLYSEKTLLRIIENDAK